LWRRRVSQDADAAAASVLSVQVWALLPGPGISRYAQRASLILLLIVRDSFHVLACVEHAVADIAARPPAPSPLPCAARASGALARSPPSCCCSSRDCPTPRLPCCGPPATHFALLVHLERPRILPCGVVAVSKAAPHHCRMLAVPHLLRHRLVLIMHLERPSVVNGVQSLVDRQQPKVCWKRQEEQHLLLLLRISDLFRSPRPQ